MDYIKLINDLIENEYNQENVLNKTFEKYVLDMRRKYKYLCIFGAGMLGVSSYYRFKDSNVSFDFFCDNNSKKVGEIITDNKKCLSFEELCKMKEDTFLINAVGDYLPVDEQLKINCFPYFDNVLESSIIYYLGGLRNNSKNMLLGKIKQFTDLLADEESLEIAYKILCYAINTCNGNKLDADYNKIYSPNQYFPKDIIKFEEGIVFVDCGAFDGDTLIDFLNRGFGEKLRKYYAYELEYTNFLELEKNIKKLDKTVAKKVVAYNIGVSNQKKKIKYSSRASSTAVSEAGEFNGQLEKLGEHLHDIPVTFIKMDIEGSELYALHGAEELIKKYEPTLAICTYHDLEHLWEIPLYLKSLVPKYKIYLRHHTKTIFETVCYAVVE